MSTRTRARYTVVVEDSDTRPAETLMARLRRFLKAALRSYGIRCVSIVEVPSVANQEQGQEAVPRKG